MSPATTDEDVDTAHRGVRRSRRRPESLNPSARRRRPRNGREEAWRTSRCCTGRRCQPRRGTSPLAVGFAIVGRCESFGRKWRITGLPSLRRGTSYDSARSARAVVSENRTGFICPFLAERHVLDAMLVFTNKSLVFEIEIRSEVQGISNREASIQRFSPLEDQLCLIWRDDFAVGRTIANSDDALGEFRLISAQVLLFAELPDNTSERHRASSTAIPRLFGATQYLVGETKSLLELMRRPASATFGSRDARARKYSGTANSACASAIRG
jgi:hypothetical protein